MIKNNKIMMKMVICKKNMFKEKMKKNNWSNYKGESSELKPLFNHGSTQKAIRNCKKSK